MPGKHDSDHRITLVLIVNGQEVSIATNVNAPLLSAVEQALAESGNTGRDLGEWEVRNASGVLLEVAQKVRELQLTDGARLFVSLRVGAGGACA